MPHSEHRQGWYNLGVWLGVHTDGVCSTTEATRNTPLFLSLSLSAGCSWRGWPCWRYWTQSESLLPSFIFQLLSTFPHSCSLILTRGVLAPAGRAWLPRWERQCWASGSAGTPWSARNSRNWRTQGKKHILFILRLEKHVSTAHTWPVLEKYESVAPQRWTWMMALSRMTRKSVG